MSIMLQCVRVSFFGVVFWIKIDANFSVNIAHEYIKGYQMNTELQECLIIKSSWNWNIKAGETENN